MDDTDPAIARAQLEMLRRAGCGRRTELARSLSRTVIDLSRHELRARMPTSSARHRVVLGRATLRHRACDTAARVPCGARWLTCELVPSRRPARGPWHRSHARNIWWSGALVTIATRTRTMSPSRLTRRRNTSFSTARSSRWPAAPKTTRRSAPRFYSHSAAHLAVARVVSIRPICGSTSSPLVSLPFPMAR